MPDNALIIIDTSDLIAALLGDNSGNKKGLSQTCHLLQIPTQFLHNAGNDAHVCFATMIQCKTTTDIRIYIVYSLGNEKHGGRRSSGHPEGKEVAESNQDWSSSRAATMARR